jgi:membrane associated rhomboid family serine protease
MSSGADLFVVCKQCGSEVSPYITECPYCGHRLRRRAPDLPREKTAGSARGLGRLRLPRVRKSGSPAAAPGLLRSRERSARRAGGSRGVDTRAGTRPYATIGLVAISCAAWVAFHARPELYLHMAIVGPIDGEWWKLLTSEFAYVYGLYAFVAIVTVAIFGWLLECRHGPVVVLALFFGAGAAGALVASAVYSVPLVSGGNGAALALLAAWAAPDLRAARGGSYYEGDLLGAAAIAALLLAMPFAPAFSEVSWLAGVTGGLLGLVLGLGMHSLSAQER